MNQPQYKHDCKQCVFLGSIGIADAYRCLNVKANTATYVIRFSSEGSDYSSYTDFMLEEEIKQRRRIGGGGDLYYYRITCIHLCATAIANLMESSAARAGTAECDTTASSTASTTSTVVICELCNKEAIPGMQCIGDVYHDFAD